MGCSPPDSSVHGIFQSRILEWVAMPSSTGSSQSRNQTLVCYISCIIAGGFFTTSPAWEALICCHSVVESCPTLCHSIDCSIPWFPVLHYLLVFYQTHVHWVDAAIQPSHPLSSPFPPALNLSQHQSFLMSWLFPSGGQSIGASASASVLLMNIQGWFPFWFPCYPRGSQESSPASQFESINLQCSAFFMVQFSHPYMNTGKIIALTIQIFLSKVMSLRLFTMLSRFVITFLPRSKCLSILWLQSPVSLEPKKIVSLFPLFLHLFAMKWWDWMPWS